MDRSGATETSNYVWDSFAPDAHRSPASHGMPAITTCDRAHTTLSLSPTPKGRSANHSKRRSAPGGYFA